MARLFLLITCMVSVARIAQAQDIQVVQKAEPATGKLRAIVMGVSTYPQLPKKNHLDFAHKDAEAIYNLLKKHPQADTANIFLRTEQRATMSEFLSLVPKTMGLSKENDICVFYFAGHGDVQADINEGFFLLSGIKSDTDYTFDDAISLTLLNLYATSAASKKAKFVLIADACRAGKVVSEKGADKTLDVLAVEWENVAKLLSCDTKQRSFEYCELGHGIFTFYLLQALQGYVNDKNNSKKLELWELRGMMETPIVTRTGSQHPKLVGASDFPILNIPLKGEKALEPLPPCKNEEIAKANGNANKGSGKARGLDEPLKETGLVREFYKSIREPEKLVRMGNASRSMQYPATSKTLVKAMSSAIQCFGRNRSKSLLAVGSSKDPVIKVYNEDDHYTSPQVVKVDGGNSSVTFSNDSKQLITGGWSYKLGAWDLSTGKRDTIFIAHTSKITALAMTSDDILVSADHGGLIKLWKYPGFELFGQLKGHTNEVTSLQLVESDKTLVSASLDGSIKVWDIAKQTNVETLPCPGARVNDIAWDPFNKVLYSAEESGKIIKWQGGTWKKLKEYPTQTEMYDIDLNVDGEYLIAGGKQYQLSILETRTMKPVEAFTESRHGNYRVSFLDNGSVVAGNFAGELIRANIDLPVPYADVLYNAIRTDPFYNDALYAYRGDYTAALLQASQKVMEPFVYGKDILPGPDEVKRGILQTEKALSLNKEEPGSVTIITCKLLFLKGLKILAENDVSRLDSAAGYFKKITELNPYATYPHNALSLVHSKKKEVDKAKASLVKASQMIPAWTEPKSNLGKNLIVEGNLKEADKAFRQIVQLEPDASKGYRGLAELALVEGDLKKSESLFKEASGKNPSVYYSCQLAYIDFLKGKYNDAFSQLENAIKADASYYLSHLYISNFYLNIFETHVDDPEYVVRAFDEATEALRLNPFSPDCYFALAQVYNRLETLKMEKYDRIESIVFRTRTGTHDYGEKKREYVKKGIELSPYDGKGYYWSALLLNRTSRADAFKVFKDKIKDKYEYFLYLGKIYREDENYLEAEKAFVQAARIKKDLYEPTLGLVTVHRRSRNYVALSTIEKSLTPRDKENPLIALEIALAYTESADRKKEGIAGAEGLLKAYPDFKKATFLLKSARGRSRTTDNIRDEIQLPFSTIKPFPDGLNLVTIGNKTYLTDNAGVVVLRTSFVPVFVTSARAMVVQSADKFGVVSFKGDTIAAFDYDEIKEEKGYLVTRTGKYYGLLNQSGKKVINSQYQALKLFDDFVAFQHGGNWGAISYRGSTIMNPRYSSISPKTYKGKPAIQGTLRNGSHYYSVDGRCLKCN